MQINTFVKRHEIHGSEYDHKVTKNEWKLLQLSQEIIEINTEVKSCRSQGH